MIAAVLVLSAVTAAVSTAQADTFRSSRARMLVHGSRDIVEGVQLRTHFVPAGDIMSGFAPYLYVGAFYEQLKLEILADWSYGTDDPGLSVRFMPEWGDVWTWTDIEVQFPSGAGYWFSQGDYRVVPWLSIGVEGEGWGEYSDMKDWSHGFGPNAVLDFGKVGVDVTVHYRGVDGEWLPEFFTRFHIFL